MNQLPAVTALVSQLKTELKEGKVASAEQYHELFHQFVGKPGTTEVKNHGEVYTPLWLVNEMLDKLPAEVWVNKDLKWFEPACGLAPFLYMVYSRLMVGLVAVLPDEVARRKHILETMLFFNELQEKNIALVKLLFNAGEYRLNIFEGDFHSTVPANFTCDIVMANPPYSKDGAKNRGDPIWDKFVRFIVQGTLLRNDGFALFIHPSNWRKPTSSGTSLFQLLRNHQIHYLNMNDAKAGKETFGCGTTYDYYILEKKPCYTTTAVVDYQRKLHCIDLKLWSWLPNSQFESLIPLLAIGNEPKCAVMYDRTAYACDQKKRIADVESPTHRYPVVRSIASSGVVRYMWSNCNDQGMYGQSKVILNDSLPFRFISDCEGRYAFGENMLAIAVESPAEADLLINVLSSSTMTDMFRACLWTNYRVNWRIFTFLKRRFWDLVVMNVSASVSDDVSASDGTSASIDIQKLQGSIGRKGYTVDQLKQLCRDHQLPFKSSDKKQVLVDKLLRVI
jgi:hypothetical protein